MTQARNTRRLALKTKIFTNFRIYFGEKTPVPNTVSQCIARQTANGTEALNAVSNDPDTDTLNISVRPCQQPRNSA